MNIKIKALLALFTTVVLWSLVVVIARGIINEIKPFTLLFIRLLVAVVAFLPFVLKRKVWKHPQFKELVKVSIFFMGNMTFFLLGIQYTSASTSQIIYATTPILVIIGSSIFLREKYPKGKLLGVFIGLVGVILIIYLSAIEKGTTITGSITGNLLITVAMLSWLAYLFSTKKILETFSPIDTSSIAIIISFLLSIPLFVYELIGGGGIIHFSVNYLTAAFFVGFIGTFITYILHQYALSHLTPLSTSLSSYIQPITTIIFEIILLGEKLTTGFVIGGSLAITGVFLATTYEFYQRYRNK